MAFKTKILVVDDEPEARAGLARMLRGKGYEVVEVGTGLEALASAKNDWPGLIVLDIVLPDIPGTEVFDRLRKDPVTKAIPVLLLTAKPDIAEKLPPSYSGTDRTFEKPGRMEDLLETIRGMLTGSK